jgi:PhnB protein
MPTDFKPAGWPTVVPRLVTSDVQGLVTFLRSTFGAHGDLSPGRPAEMKISDSIILVSDGDGIRQPSAAFLYVYVEDTDGTFRRAIEAGAEEIEPPADMPYGDRRATVQDPWGNTWQIATRRS